MSAFSKIRSMLSVIVSVGIHVSLAVAMLAIPRLTREKYETVDLSVVQQKKVEPKPEPEPEPEAPEPEPEPEPEKPKIKKAPPKEKVAEEPPPPPPPEEQKAPEKVEEAPPVFDLGDNSFAEGSGQGGSWKLQRSEGNTKLAAVASRAQKSVRDTKPIASPQGKPGGKGTSSEYRPIPLKDLSKRPEPKNGSVPVPAYPVEARRADIEGPVVMQVFLDKRGRVRRMRIIKSPSDILAEAAKRTMSEVLWTPALDKIGNPVDTVFVYTFRFVLDG
jgi:TonB family protein